jgi:hypothetical protein
LVERPDAVIDRGVILMTADKKPVPALDPDNVPVRIVNGVQGIDYLGSVFDWTLCTARLGVNSEGQLESQNIICARLRFDLQIAHVLRDALDRQIALLARPPDSEAN